MIHDSRPRPLILVANDDGYDAPGIRHLTDALRGLGRIVVVAPDAPRSGASCSFTAHSDVRLRRIEGPAYGDGLSAADGGEDVTVYACSGTPMDCIKVALHHLFARRRPDLIVSGINHGGNDSICVVYSGTMGAVLEGCIVGIPAIGFSLLEYNWNADFTAARRVARHVAQRVLAEGLPRGVVLNVNIPYRPDLRGIRVCRQADGYWHREYEDLQVSADECTFRVAGEYANREPEATDTDEYWLAKGYVTIVPTQVDLTAHARLTHCRTLFDSEGIEEEREETAQ